MTTPDTPPERISYEDFDRMLAERDNWIETANSAYGDVEFYQGIVRQIGELFGEAAKTSDDGSIQQDVLALKVPELVEALKAERDNWKERYDGTANAVLALHGDVSQLEEMLFAALHSIDVGNREMSGAQRQWFDSKIQEYSAYD